MIADRIGLFGGTLGQKWKAKHPPRILLEKPLTLEFASPIPGTYPFWYDPSYWYARSKPHFDIRQQLEVLPKQARIYKQMFFDMAPFVSGAAVLAVFMIYGQKWPTNPRNSYWQLIWPIGALAAYALAGCGKQVKQVTR